MSYILAGTTIKAPNDMNEGNNTQVAQQRPLSGNNTRDYFGSNKRVWTLNYANISKADYDIINAIYQAYLAAGNPVSFQSTETNYPVSSTNVHIDLPQRSFKVGGSDYISDFNLTLTEN